LRHRSEQNFTSSQERAQRLRHVMGRPQHWQGFVGRVCLFPLKAAVVLFIKKSRLAFDCDADPKDMRMEGRLSTRC